MNMYLEMKLKFWLVSVNMGFILEGGDETSLTFRALPT